MALVGRSLLRQQYSNSLQQCIHVFAPSHPVICGRASTTSDNPPLARGAACRRQRVSQFSSFNSTICGQGGAGAQHSDATPTSMMPVSWQLLHALQGAALERTWGL